MSRLPARLVTLTVLAAASSAAAIDFGLGLLKRKQPPQAPAKADPPPKAKQLLATLQSDPDVDRRKAAADALKAVDPRSNPEALAVLVGSLHKDPSPAVRMAVAEALGGVTSASPPVAAALAEVEKSDPDAGVRSVAKTALWRYQLNAEKTAASTAPGEPPFARTPAPPAPAPGTGAVPVTLSEPRSAEPTFRPITQGPGKAGVYRETAEPPFAPPPGQGKPAPKPVIAAAPPPAPPAAAPGELPPLDIPVVPPVATGSGVPTIRPPGK